MARKKNTRSNARSESESLPELAQGTVDDTPDSRMSGERRLQNSDDLAQAVLELIEQRDRWDAQYREMMETLDSKQKILEDRETELGERERSVQSLQRKTAAQRKRMAATLRAQRAQATVELSTQRSADFIEHVQTVTAELNGLLERTRTAFALPANSNDPQSDHPQPDRPQSGIVAGESPSSNAKPDGDPHAAWNERKRELLKSFSGDSAPPAEGISPQTPAAASGKVPTATANAETEVPRSMEPEEISALREQLEQKLRQAEIDVSIERAKVSRMESELESRLHELNEKMKSLDIEGRARGRKKKSSSRISRFLPGNGADDPS